MKILLIEDNPGDVRMIEELLREGKELLQRVDLDEPGGRFLRIKHETRLADGIERLESSEFDVILLDLNLPDSTGIDTLKSISDSLEMLPIVVLAGLDDRQLGTDVIHQGAQDYLVKDEVTVDTLVRTIHHAIERNRLEREQIRRREQLEALNDLNQIAQDVTHIVITTSERDELEREICERLVASDIYCFAWIGGVTRGSDRVTARVAAGVDGDYPETVSITIDDETGEGPTGRAIRTHEVQTARNIQADPGYEPWREQVKAYGFQSSAAIPIVYEGIRYGVLNVYATSPNAFSKPEIEILTRLGDGIGHATASIERKNALVSDVVLELEFQVTGLADELSVFSADHSGRIQIQNLTSYDGTVRAYGTASGFSEAAFHDAIDRAESVDDYRRLPGNADESSFRFEFAFTEAHPLFEAVAAHGGRIRSMDITDGDLRIVVELPRGNDTRQVIGLIQNHVTDASLLAQRTVQRSENGSGDFRSVFGDLTEKQQKALQTAYFGGYFNWPRTSNASEIAEQLGISSATFTEHLRTAERKFFDTVFDESAAETDADMEISPKG